jgi:hypothetical protein
MTAKHHTDQYGRHSYKNYTIEAWRNADDGMIRSYSIYNRYNSMYDNKDGFRSIEEAVAYIDRQAGR